MARETNTEERRTQIADALIRVMAEQGYAGASIGAIAKAAELTPGLLHYHFKSKHAILLEAIALLERRHLRALSARLERCATPDTKLKAFIEMHLRADAKSADPHALACWVLLSGEALRDEQTRERFEETLRAISDLLLAIIAEGKKQKRFRVKDPKIAVAAILATIQGYFVLAASARSLIPPGSASSATLQMARGLLGATR